MTKRSLGFTYQLAAQVNRVACRILYKVHSLSLTPFPEHGPVILVSDHSSYSDPLVLAAMTRRPVTFLVASNIFQLPGVRWLFQTFHYISVSRGKQDWKALRSMLRALEQREVLGIFPEGGIDEFRADEGHPGVGYLALKTGAPVVPVSIWWNEVRPLHLLQSLITPGKATVCFGTPFRLPAVSRPSRVQIHAATARIMQAIQELKDSTGIRTLNTSSLLACSRTENM